MGRMNRIGMQAALCSAIAVALLAARPVAAAVTLLDATPSVGLDGPVCSFPAVFSEDSGICPSPHVGTSASEDLTPSPGRMLELQATATPFGPVASVVGEGSGTPPFSGSAEAEVDYEIEVTPVSGLVLKVSSVPVTLTAMVEANASGSVDFAYARAEAGFVGTIQACTVGEVFPGDIPCVSSPTNSISGSAPPNEPIQADVFAVGGGSMFEASADPLFEIADELIPGTDINFRDAFTVVVSANVTQSAGPGPAPPPGVPEPSSALLLAAPLALLCAAVGAARKDRQNAGNRPA